MADTPGTKIPGLPLVAPGNIGLNDLMVVESAAGVTQRTLVSSIRDWLIKNVLPAVFGARLTTSLTDYIANNAVANILDYAAVSGSDSTAAIAAAEANLPAQTGGGATGGGAIVIPEGQFLTSGWTPTVLNMPIRGRGQYTSRIRGTGAGGATVSLTGQGRLRFSDLSVEGNVKNYAMQAVGTASIVLLDNVRLLGGLLNVLLLGATGTDPDVSEWVLVNSTIQSEAGTTGAPLKIRGNNTGPISVQGGHISTGPVAGVNAVDIDDGAHVTFYSANLLADTSVAAIYARSGTVQMFGGHTEAGALLETLVGDARTDQNTPPHMLMGVTCATPGVLSDVVHNAHRTLLIGGCRFAGNVSVGAGATVVDLGGNSFAAGKGFVVTAGGFLYGSHNGTTYPKVLSATDLSAARDYSVGGGVLTLAAGATATILNLNYGKLELYDLTHGPSATIGVTNNATRVVEQSGTGFSITAGTGSKINVYPSSANVVIQNSFAGAVDLRVVLERVG